MSTPNFKQKNARCIYACNTKDPFFWDDFRAEIPDRLLDEAPEWSVDFSDDKDRFYPTLYFAEREYNKTVDENKFYAVAKIGLRCGYYDCANYDYEIALYEEDNSFSETFLDGNSVEDMVNCFLKYGINGEVKGNYDEVFKEVSSFVNSIIGECEKLCKSFADKVFTKIGVFSNGEAIYR